MFGPKLLPWEYGVRNLLRRPVRTALTLAALVIVVLLVLVVVGFIRGLERSLATSGDRQTVLVYSMTAGANVESSAIAAGTASLLAASLPGIQQRRGQPVVSPELYLGTRVKLPDSEHFGLGLVRGVTTFAPLVRRSVRIVEGSWPAANEVLVGRLAAAKLGVEPEALAIGNTISFEKREWRISGRFAAGGASFESEIWCPLEEFQSVLKRQDLSLVALLLKPEAQAADVELFCKQRTDLEVQAVRETEHYAALQQHYRPVRLLAWTVVLLVSGAGLFAGLNLMYGAIAGRVREIATLRAVGYRRRAVLVSLLQEGLLLSALASLIAGAVAFLGMNGLAVRFTMGAFVLRIDGAALLTGCAAGVLLGVVGALPPAIKALRSPVAAGLKAV